MRIVFSALLSYSLLLSSCASLNLATPKKERITRTTTTRVLARLTPQSPFSESQESPTYKEKMNKLSEFYKWFKDEVDFAIRDGIQKRSRNSVLTGLQNIRTILKDYNSQDLTGIGIGPTKALQSLNEVSQKHLNIFSRNQHLQATDYVNLDRDYQAVLRTFSDCCHQEIQSHKILRDFIERESQVTMSDSAFYLILMIASGLVVIGMLKLSLWAAYEEQLLTDIRRYNNNLRACQNKKSGQRINYTIYKDEHEKYGRKQCSCFGPQRHLHDKECWKLEEDLNRHELNLCKARQDLIDCWSSASSL